MFGVCFDFFYEACRVKSLNNNYKFAGEKRKSKKVCAMIGRKNLSNYIICHSFKGCQLCCISKKKVLKSRVNYFGRTCLAYWSLFREFKGTIINDVTYWGWIRVPNVRAKICYSQMTIKVVGRLGPDLKTLFMYCCQDLTLRKAKKLILNM